MNLFVITLACYATSPTESAKAGIDNLCPYFHVLDQLIGQFFGLKNFRLSNYIVILCFRPQDGTTFVMNALVCHVSVFSIQIRNEVLNGVS